MNIPEFFNWLWGQVVEMWNELITTPLGIFDLVVLYGGTLTVILYPIIKFVIRPWIWSIHDKKMRRQYPPLPVARPTFKIPEPPPDEPIKEESEDQKNEDDVDEYTPEEWAALETASDEAFVVLRSSKDKELVNLMIPHFFEIYGEAINDDDWNWAHQQLDTSNVPA